MKKFFISVVFMSVLIITFQACKTKQGKTEKLSGTITIDGSSTVYPITEAVAEEFRKIQPDIKVTVGLSGTGGGFKKFGRGETDINDASRPIKDEEIELAKSNNIKYIDLTVAFDGLAVIVHPENNWCNSITIEELKKIWEPAAQNKIKKWNQIRPEWPDQEIHLFGPGVESGTYDYFTEAVVGTSHSSRGDFTASEDDNVLVQGVASDKYSLGFFGLAYFAENKDKLKLVGLDHGNGPVIPTMESVRDKSYYLARPLFLYINNKAAERKEVQEFVSFYLDNVNELSEEVGYIPLTEQELQIEKEKWNNFLKEHQPK